MSSEKGITLTSLVIYVIGATIIFSIVANITIFFNKNSRLIEYTANNSAQITRLNEYLINDTKKENITMVNVIDKTKIQINTKNENIKYTLKNDGIYRNKVKICSYVKNAEFIKEVKNNKTILKINISVGEEQTEQKNLQYVI